MHRAASGVSRRRGKVRAGEPGPHGGIGAWGVGAIGVLGSWFVGERRREYERVRAATTTVHGRSRHLVSAHDRPTWVVSARRSANERTADDTRGCRVSPGQPKNDTAMETEPRSALRPHRHRKAEASECPVPVGGSSADAGGADVGMNADDRVLPNHV